MNSFNMSVDGTSKAAPKGAQTAGKRLLFGVCPHMVFDMCRSIRCIVAVWALEFVLL